MAAIASIPADASRSTRPRLSSRIAPWMLASGVVGLSAVVDAFVIGSARVGQTESTTRPAVPVALDLGPDVSLTSDLPVVAHSPDGARIVFVSTGPDGIPRLSTRRLDRVEATSLRGTEGGTRRPSPRTGRRWDSLSPAKLKKIRLDGGAPAVLCDATAGRGGSWSEDGSIVAALDQRRGLSAVSSNGGAVSSLTELIFVLNFFDEVRRRVAGGRE